jgi:predicted metal-dependent peptidase
VIAIDTSGSVSNTELRQFLGEVSSILGDCRPKSLTLMWCDAAVDGVTEYTEPEELREDVAVTRGVTGRGGTSFIPPFEYVRDNGLECDLFIYLTDGYGPFPKEDLAPFPTIWCISNDKVVAPFGTTIPILEWSKGK